MAKKMIPLEEAARILGISTKALRKQIRDGKQEGQLAGHKGFVAVEEGLLAREATPKVSLEPDDKDKEIAGLEKDIKIAELKGHLAKPEALAKREVALREGDQILEANLQQLETDRAELVAKANIVAKKEADVATYIKGHSHLKAEVTALMAKKAEFLGLVNEAISQIDFLQDQYACFSQGNLPNTGLKEIAQKIRAVTEL